jgi:hypothetical protein
LDSEQQSISLMRSAFYVQIEWPLHLLLYQTVVNYVQGTTNPVLTVDGMADAMQRACAMSWRSAKCFDVKKIITSGIPLEIFASAIDASPQWDFQFIKYFDAFGDTNLIENRSHVTEK